MAKITVQGERSGQKVIIECIEGDDGIIDVYKDGKISLEIDFLIEAENKRRNEIPCWGELRLKSLSAYYFVLKTDYFDKPPEITIEGDFKPPEIPSDADEIIY